MGYHFWNGKDIRAKSNPQRVANARHSPLSKCRSNLERLVLEAWIWCMSSCGLVGGD